MKSPIGIRVSTAVHFCLRMKGEKLLSVGQSYIQLLARRYFGASGKVFAGRIEASVRVRFDSYDTYTILFPNRIHGGRDELVNLYQCCSSCGLGIAAISSTNSVDWKTLIRANARNSREFFPLFSSDWSSAIRSIVQPRRVLFVGNALTRRQEQLSSNYLEF